MRRGLTASGLFVAGMWAAAAAAQPPAVGPAPPPKPAEKKATDKKAAEVDVQIEAALANDPDIRMARAKIQLAEAELAKARQAVAIKVTTLRSGIAVQRAAYEIAAEQAAAAEQRVRVGGGSRDEYLLAREKGAAAQAKMAGLEAELKLLVGDGRKATALPPDQDPDVVAQLSAMLGHDQHRRAAVALLALTGRADRPVPACNVCHKVDKPGDLLEQDFHGCPGIRQEVARPAVAAPKGAVADRVRAALDKPVALGAKDQKVTFEQAVELFKKDAGLDVPVRAETKVGAVVSLGETLPVGAWLQLFADGTPGTRILLREYGLLVTTKELAPPDAASAFEVWKQKPAAPKADGPKRLISVRFQGQAIDLPDDAVGRYEAAFRAAVELIRAGKDSPVHPDPAVEWAKALDRDHVRFVIPDPRAFGLGSDEGVEIVVGMVDPLTPPAVAWARAGGKRVSKVTDFPADKAKAYTDAGRPGGVPKK